MVMGHIMAGAGIGIMMAAIGITGITGVKDTQQGRRNIHPKMKNTNSREGMWGGGIQKNTTQWIGTRDGVIM